MSEDLLPLKTVLRNMAKCLNSGYPPEAERNIHRAVKLIQSAYEIAEKGGGNGLGITQGPHDEYVRNQIIERMGEESRSWFGKKIPAWIVADGRDYRCPILAIDDHYGNWFVSYIMGDATTAKLWQDGEWTFGDYEHSQSEGRKHY